MCNLFLQDKKYFLKIITFIFWFSLMPKKNLFLIWSLVVLLVVAFVMVSQWRLLISASGNIMLWVWDIFSSENSQQIFDPYSYSHFQHGLFFYFFFRFVFSIIFGKKLHYYELFLLAVMAEWVREIAENSQYVIDLYRNNTSALWYTGDTVLNSLFDIFACLLWAIFAHKVWWKWTLFVFFLIEISMVILLRDSLLLNVLMLTYPIEAVKNWQLGL